MPGATLIPRDEMTTLLPTSDVQTIAANAEDAIQLQAVAYAINNAANTGEYSTTFLTKLRPYTVQQLKTNGYKIRYTGTPYDIELRCIISWFPEEDD